MVKRFGLIIIGFFIISMQLSLVGAVSSNENTQTTLNQPLQASLTPISFSYFVNSATEQIQLFTVTMNNNNNTIILADYNINYNYPGSYGFKTINVDMMDFNYSISTFRYYNSGQHLFFIVDDYSANLIKNFNIFVDGLNSSNSFHLDGDYNILSVTQFTGSNNVYFTLYNSSEIIVLQYLDATSQFTIYYESNALNTNNYQIQKADSFLYDDYLYIVYYYENSTTQSYNSTVLTFKNNVDHPVFNKTFTQKRFTSLYPFNEGLILYSFSTGNFYRYQYNVDTIVNRLFYNGNFSSIRPFGNSLLAIDKNSLSVYAFTKISDIGFDLVREKYYKIDNPEYPANENSIQAFMINSNRYYLLNIKYSDHYSFILDTINTNPMGILTSTTFPYPFYNNPGSQDPYTYTTTYSYHTYTQTQYTYTSYSQSNISSSIFIVLLMLIIAGLAIAYAVSNKNRNRYYPPRNDTYLNNYETRNPRRTQRVSNFCDTCGSTIDQTDIFCQNCGSRLSD